MMVALNFNAQSVAPSAGFDPLPAGWYNVKITDSEMKPTRAGDGSYLALTMEVLDGQYANRKLFVNLNLSNKNPTAVNIAYADLSAICRVVGVVDCQDSSQLHGIPFQAKVSVRPATEQYDASNDVRGYRDQYGRDPKDLAAAPAAGPAAPAAPGAPAAPSAPAPQEHVDAQGNRYLLINNEWVLQASQPAPPPAAPPAPAAPPPPPAAPAAPPAAPPAPPAAPATPPPPPAAPPATPAAPAGGGAITPPWGPPKA